jgi:hypothetical protein
MTQGKEWMIPWSTSSLKGKWGSDSQPAIVAIEQTNTLMRRDWRTR